MRQYHSPMPRAYSLTEGPPALPLPSPADRTRRSSTGTNDRADDVSNSTRATSTTTATRMNVASPAAPDSTSSRSSLPNIQPNTTPSKSARIAESIQALMRGKKEDKRPKPVEKKGSIRRSGRKETTRHTPLRREDVNHCVNQKGNGFGSFRRVFTRSTIIPSGEEESHSPTSRPSERPLRKNSTRDLSPLTTITRKTDVNFDNMRSIGTGKTPDKEKRKSKEKEVQGNTTLPIGAGGVVPNPYLYNAMFCEQQQQAAYPHNGNVSPGALFNNNNNAINPLFVNQNGFYNTSVENGESGKGSNVSVSSSFDSFSSLFDAKNNRWGGSEGSLTSTGSHFSLLGPGNGVQDGDQYPVSIENHSGAPQNGANSSLFGRLLSNLSQGTSRYSYPSDRYSMADTQDDQSNGTRFTGRATPSEGPHGKGAEVSSLCLAPSSNNGEDSFVSQDRPEGEGASLTPDRKQRSSSRKKVNRRKSSTSSGVHLSMTETNRAESIHLIKEKAKRRRKQEDKRNDEVSTKSSKSKKSSKKAETPIATPAANFSIKVPITTTVEKRETPPTFTANRSAIAAAHNNERQEDFISRRSGKIRISDENGTGEGDGKKDLLGFFPRSQTDSDTSSVSSEREKRVGMYFNGNNSLNDVREFINGGDTSSIGSGSLPYRQPSDLEIKSKKGLRLMKEQEQLNNTIKTLLIVDPSMSSFGSDLEFIADEEGKEDQNSCIVRVSKPVNDGTRPLNSGVYAYTSTGSITGGNDYAEGRCTEIMRGVSLDKSDEQDYMQSQLVQDARNVFVYGCNASLLLADMNASHFSFPRKGGRSQQDPLTPPSRWPSWSIVKQMMKSAFKGFSKIFFELTVSVSLIEDDEVLDLLACTGKDSENDTFRPLLVAESPLFGYVPEGMLYVGADNFDEYVAMVEMALEKADKHFLGSSKQAALGEKEQGIVLLLSVLKQVKPSGTNTNTDHTEIKEYVKECVEKNIPLNLSGSSNGSSPEVKNFGKDYDLVVSSLFVSGVGDGIAHYTRILDKNPAEPRALFQFVLYRSVHSNTIFTLYDTPQVERPTYPESPDFKNSLREVYATVNTLNRFSETRLRKPWRGNVRVFLVNARKKLKTMKGSIDKITENKQKVKQVQFIERLELMAIDAQELLENSINAPLKTYLLHTQ